ncbi:cupin domain-containing protein [Subtercola frigoramans]|uniref:Cupin superfamily protein n=1 Tax=Subtercola frigoramans TaxID=120298 RepID=A0ABS2L9A6_9MICO|nr:cupin domain-containing protein [Subtercola frigoramans]MBM7473670.1 putative cupin superfamily protein [Subtercola frigoramans]
MVTSPFGKPVIGNRDANPAHWAPGSWVEPASGTQTKGESVVIREGSTTGLHRAGLWRSGIGVPGCEPDGSCRIDYSAPDGDETLVVLDGEARVTVTGTGETHVLRPGSIVSHPKGLGLTWEITSAAFRKFWVIWDSPDAAAADDHLYVRHVDDDDPASWEPYEWDDADGRHWRCGENLVMRSTGSTGSLKCGLWRSGPDTGDGTELAAVTPEAGSVCEGSRCAGHTISASRGIGDESMLLLNGRAHIVNHDSGEEFDVEPGDIIAQYMGPNITWTSKSRYMKKFFIMTNATVPA